MHRIALAGKESDGLVERQADDGRVGTDELDHERPGNALDGVAAGLVAPFGAGEIALDLAIAEALEAEPRLNEAAARGARHAEHGDGGIDAMVAAREQMEAGARL